MLKCEYIRPKLSAYIDREVPLWEAQIIRWHLNRCHECEFEYTLLMDTAKAMKAFPEVTTSDNFLREVMTKAAMIAVHERQELNFRQRIMKHFKARFASFKYIFYVLRSKATAYAMAFTILVVLGYFMTAMPKLLTPPLSKPHQMLVKGDANREKGIIPVEFVTPERLRYIQGRLMD